MISKGIVGKTSCRRAVRPRLTNRGISLVEVMVCALIMGGAILGLFQLFLYCSALSDMSGNITRAVMEAQGKIEEIREHPFSDIIADYDGTAFSLVGLTGMGRVSIDSTNPKRLGVRVVVCWQNQNGRVIGEDQNLNGVLDAGEDDGDNVMESMVTMESYVAKL